MDIIEITKVPGHDRSSLRIDLTAEECVENNLLVITVLYDEGTLTTKVDAYECESNDPMLMEMQYFQRHMEDLGVVEDTVADMPSSPSP